MKLEDLQTELDKDLEIDYTKLELEAGNNPKLYGKWLRYYSNCKKEMLVIEAKKKRALKNRLDYYTGRADEVSTDLYEKSEMKTVLSADSEIVKVDAIMNYWMIMMDFCGSAMDAVKSKGFSVKHIIDLRKFESGAN